VERISYEVSDLLPLGRRWLSFLHPLLLLYMSLLQLLRLLLMALLDLLFPRLIGILPLDPLVFFILFSLNLLPLLLLLSKYFLLLLLIFAVFRRRGTSKWREVSWMYRIGRCTLSSRLCIATIGRRIVRRACRLCGYDGPVAKRRRLWSGSDGRLAAVGRGMQVALRTCSLQVLSLSGDRRKMARTRGRFFLWPRTSLNTARTAIVADSIDGHVVVDHGLVVNVPNIYDVDVGYRAVIEKPVTLPPSTYVAKTEIPEPINNPAIEADLRTPVAIVENIGAIVPSPVGRCPQETDFRS
jgi:hypothetical protein